MKTYKITVLRSSTEIRAKNKRTAMKQAGRWAKNKIALSEKGK